MQFSFLLQNYVTPPAKLPLPQQYNPPLQNKNIWSPTSKDLQNFYPPSQAGGRVHALNNNNGLYQEKFVQDKWAILGP